MPYMVVVFNNLVLPVDAFRQISIASKFLGRVDVMTRTWQDQVTPTSVKLFFESYKLTTIFTMGDVIAVSTVFVYHVVAAKTRYACSAPNLPSLRGNVYLLNAHMIDILAGGHKARNAGRHLQATIYRITQAVWDTV